MVMSLTLIGQKKGMTQIFDQEGNRVVCTVIQAVPNTILQIKRKETHGYNGLQLAGIPLAASKVARMPKPQKGQFAKVNVEPSRVVHESRVESVDEYQVGQKLDLTLFSEARYVDIEGVSKGKGYQGVIKLHKMAGGPGAHGSGFHRHMGSTGMRTTPGRCFPNGKRPSRMGGDRKTVLNLKVVAIRGDLLLVEGAVPGARSGTVFIRKARKG